MGSDTAECASAPFRLPTSDARRRQTVPQDDHRLTHSPAAERDAWLEAANVIDQLERCMRLIPETMRPDTSGAREYIAEIRARPAVPEGVERMREALEKVDAELCAI